MEKMAGSHGQPMDLPRSTSADQRNCVKGALIRQITGWDMAGLLLAEGCEIQAIIRRGGRHFRNRQSLPASRINLPIRSYLLGFHALPEMKLSCSTEEDQPAEESSFCPR